MRRAPTTAVPLQMYRHFAIVADSLAAEESGYSTEYLASLSEEERELLLKGMRENGLLSEAGRDAREDALVAASRRRSGAPAGDD